MASQGVRGRPAAIAILESHENHEWGSGLAVNGLYHLDEIRGLLEKYPTFGREKETGLLGALDT